MLPDLGKDPWVTHRAPSDHQTSRSSRGKGLCGIARSGDIAVGDHRTGKFPGGQGDQVVTDAAPVHLQDRAAVDCDKIDRMFPEQWQEQLERPLVVEPEPRLDRELSRDRLAQGPENSVHTWQVAEESASGALAIDDRRGATEVEIDGGGGMFLQFLARTDKGGDVIADHLRDDGAARGITDDRVEDRLVESRGRVDSEILGVVQVRAAVAGHQFPEGPVGHILHRRERKHGGARDKKRIESGGHGPLMLANDTILVRSFSFH